MKKIYPDPNVEVEKWKDEVYKKIKDLHGRKLANYFEKRGKGILKEYKIKYVSERLKKDVVLAK